MPHRTPLAAAWQEPDTRFVRVPAALHDLVLTPREFQVIALLLSFRWTPDALIYPSVRTLATRLHCSERTVQRTCAALEARGLLVRQPNYRDDGGQRSNTYQLAGPLLALVTRTVDRPAAAPGRTQHPPVTRWSGKRDSGNRDTRTTARERLFSRIPQDAGAYLQTRTGVLSRR